MQAAMSGMCGAVVHADPADLGIATQDREHPVHAAGVDGTTGRRREDQSAWLAGEQRVHAPLGERHGTDGARRFRRAEDQLLPDSLEGAPDPELPVHQVDVRPGEFQDFPAPQLGRDQQLPQRVQTVSPGGLQDSALPLRPGDALLRVSRWVSPRAGRRCAPRVLHGLPAGAPSGARRFMVRDGDVTAATITLTSDAEDGSWSSKELADPSMFVNKLTVARTHAGLDLGGRLLDWARGRA